MSETLAEYKANCEKIKKETEIYLSIPKESSMKQEYEDKMKDTYEDMKRMAFEIADRLTK